MQLRLHTLPSPAMWKLASVEKTIKCRAFCRQPISLVQTIACIIASSPPSGESKLPDTGASCTRVWKLINQRREINYYAKKRQNYFKKSNVFGKRHLILVSVWWCAWFLSFIQIARWFQSGRKGKWIMMDNKIVTILMERERVKLQDTCPVAYWS